jgi:hypothetical protein
MMRGVMDCSKPSKRRLISLLKDRGAIHEHFTSPITLHITQGSFGSMDRYERNFDKIPKLYKKK